MTKTKAVDVSHNNSQLQESTPLKTQNQASQDDFYYSPLQGREISKIIALFHKTINPVIEFGNKTQRNACQFLIEKFGYEKTEKMSKYAISIQGEKYAPTVTSPWDLKQKLAKVFVFYKKSLSIEKPSKQGKNYDVIDKKADGNLLEE